ncbi:MAG: GntR family transcriptional regulator [Muribaculaceae bacterium]|nr:GntR family transcriptional regulator [Muribaculaceae bacterium]
MEIAEFKSGQPIYRQIVTAACSNILSGAWADGAKIPSARELAVDLAVNTRTVLKATDYLQEQGIIYPKRGMGYYTVDNARQKVYELLRREFFSETVPQIAGRIRELGISPDDLAEYLKKYQEDHP